MRLKKLSIAFAVTALAAIVPASSASAVPPTNVTVTPTVIQPDPNGGDLGFTAPQITASGFAPFQIAVIQQCSISKNLPEFDFTDCEPISQFFAPADANGNLNVSYRSAFIGDSLSDFNFACGYEGFVSPNDYPVFNTCYIQVTKDTAENYADAVEVPITFSEGEPVIPETPYAALLPLGALAVLGGGYLVLRNRRAGVTAH